MKQQSNTLIYKFKLNHLIKYIENCQYQSFSQLPYNQSHAIFVLSFQNVAFKLQQAHLPMTSQITQPQTIFECPICLASLVSPISLTCGHSFCQTCIKSRYFSLVKQACPLCRKPLACELELYSVNVILQQILINKYGSEKTYLQRLQMSKKSIQVMEKSLLNRIKKWLKQKLPWIVILVLLYHLFKMKVNFFSLKFKDYKDKAMAIANSIKVQNSLDFKFLLFSQFMRLLFSTIVIP